MRLNHSRGEFKNAKDDYMRILLSCCNEMDVDGEDISDSTIFDHLKLIKEKLNLLVQLKNDFIYELDMQGATNILKQEKINEIKQKSEEYCLQALAKTYQFITTLSQTKDYSKQEITQLKNILNSDERHEQHQPRFKDYESNFNQWRQESHQHKPLENTINELIIFIKQQLNQAKITRTTKFSIII
jgi:hypothetical protein